MIQNEGTFDPAHPTPSGQTLHGDHAYVFYQIPENAHRLPLVFLHGHGQSRKTWETTPDGREGFQTIFLRKNFGVYLLDQPRRGAAGRSTVDGVIPCVPDEQQIFNGWRLGVWPEFYENVSFSRDPAVLDQYFRQCTPNTAGFDLEIVSDGVAAAIDRIGDCILVTHSQGGGVGWAAATKTGHVKGIVSFEPGTNFAFPEGEVPDPIYASDPSDVLFPRAIPKADFEKFTQYPIMLYYGDNIPDRPVSDYGQDHWRLRYEMAKIWVDTVNAHGGNAQVVHLPERGIYGNTHFPFSDTNNLEVAGQMEEFLHAQKLDLNE